MNSVTPYRIPDCAVDYCREKARYELVFICGLPLTVALCKGHQKEIAGERANHAPR